MKVKLCVPSGSIKRGEILVSGNSYTFMYYEHRHYIVVSGSYTFQFCEFNFFFFFQGFLMHF